MVTCGGVGFEAFEHIDLSSAWRKAANWDAWRSVVVTATLKTSLPWKKKNYYLRQGGCVFIGGSELVCLLAKLCKNYSADFHKIRRIMWKNRSDFGVNPDHVTLGLGLGLGYKVTIRWGTAIPRVLPGISLIVTNYSVTSAALTEVCAVLSAILVRTISDSAQHR